MSNPDPDTRRKHQLKHKFNMTVEQYQAIHDSQRGLCAICELPCSTGRNLAVDHDHLNKKNRGLLCGLCNRALERIESTPGWCAKALAYLAQYSRPGV